MNLSPWSFSGAAVVVLVAFAGMGSSGFVPRITHADTASTASICTTLSRNLWVGTHNRIDAYDVSAYQQFLKDQGYYSGIPTGYFGALTLRATIRFQRDNGVNPSGYVGGMTRALIHTKYCVTTPPTSSLQIQSLSASSGAVGSSVTIQGSGFDSDNTVHFGYGVVVHVPSYNGSSITFTVPSSLDPACRFSFPMCAIASRQTLPGTYPISVENSRGTSNTLNFVVTDGTITATPITLYSITPATGPVGTTVSIRGFGFTSNNTIRFGNGAIMNIPISSSVAIACTTDPNCHGGINQTLTFIIPSSVSPYCAPGMMCAMYMQLITPGTYTLYVQNENGSSNPVSFAVTDGTSSSNSPSITGIDAPATLPIGSTGTWTVHALLPAGANGNLSYSVTWGDQYAAANAFAAPAPMSVQSTATFTHSYSQAGTYMPLFTVTDSNGRSATVSTSVVVTPMY